MSGTVAEAAGALAAQIEAENAALAAMAIAQACALLPEKTACARRLETALAAMGEPGPDADTAAALRRLIVLAEENRTLLRRAIRVQSRLLDMLARASSLAPTYARNARAVARATPPARLLSRC